MIQELNPKTIIEFGSFKGGSALWLADIQALSTTEGKVISLDIDMSNISSTVKTDHRIEFIQGDSERIDTIFTPELLKKIVHPILLIEDAHINTLGILDYFHKHILQAGDYFIVEDTNLDYNNKCYDVWQKTMDPRVALDKLTNLNNKIINLQKWLQDKSDMYLVDTKYVDAFETTNATKNWNSVIKKMY